jgi:hypothetical protein
MRALSIRQPYAELILRRVACSLGAMATPSGHGRRRDAFGVAMSSLRPPKDMATRQAGRADIHGMRALSIRQPYAELILRGIKTVEYRSRRRGSSGSGFTSTRR